MSSSSSFCLASLIAWPLASVSYNTLHSVQGCIEQGTKSYVSETEFIFEKKVEFSSLYSSQEYYSSLFSASIMPHPTSFYNLIKLEFVNCISKWE